MREERTTKYVTLTLKATFHGGYIDADEVTGHLQGWIEGGLEDRDDLRNWSYGVASVVEVDGDPEGFDAPDESEYECIDGEPEHDYSEIECVRCGAISQ